MLLMGDSLSVFLMDVNVDFVFDIMYENFTMNNFNRNFQYGIYYSYGGP